MGKGHKNHPNNCICGWCNPGAPEQRTLRKVAMQKDWAENPERAKMSGKLKARWANAEPEFRKTWQENISNSWTDDRKRALVERTLAMYSDPVWQLARIKRVKQRRAGKRVRRNGREWCVWSADGEQLFKEHRVVAEKSIGRPILKEEVVHHIDLDHDNNTVENLCIVSKAEHRVMHNFDAWLFPTMKRNPLFARFVVSRLKAAGLVDELLD